MTDEPVVERASTPAEDNEHGVRLEVGAFGPWETNAYLVWDGRSADALVLDPGMGAAAPLMERIGATWTVRQLGIAGVNCDAPERARVELGLECPE